MRKVCIVATPQALGPQTMKDVAFAVSVVTRVHVKITHEPRKE